VDDQTDIKQELTQITERAALVMLAPLLFAIWEFRYDHVSGGINWLLWSLAPLAFILMFSWPARCRVIFWEDRRVCDNMVGGFLFGCVDEAHKWDKVFARLWLNRGALGKLQRHGQWNGQSLPMHHPQSNHPTQIKDDARTTCAFWAGMVTTVATIAQLIVAIMALH
jgi:hypothetical protein